MNTMQNVYNAHMEKITHPILILAAANIRKYRKQLGISQEELADRAGCHRTYVGMVERYEVNITLTNLYKMSEALQVHITELLK